MPMETATKPRSRTCVTDMACSRRGGRTTMTDVDQIRHDPDAATALAGGHASHP
jgi:hypothetical protein